MGCTSLLHPHCASGELEQIIRANDEFDFLDHSSIPIPNHCYVRSRLLAFMIPFRISTDAYELEAYELETHHLCDSHWLFSMLPFQDPISWVVLSAFAQDADERGVFR